MAAIAPGQTANCSNPVLDVYFQGAGILTDVASLEYIIFDNTNQNSPVQVYPSSGRATVNLADCPTGGRLSKGHYCASWTVPDDEVIGSHAITWFFKLTNTSPEQTFTETFEVLPVVGGSSDNDYCLVSDLRSEGVTTTDADDARCQMMISMASRYIERITRRFFNPRSLTVDQNGNGSGTHFYDQPVIAIDSINITIEGISFSGQPIDLNDVAIYNRHITQNLLSPDDRDNPRVQFKRADPEFARLHALLGRRIFYEGKLNIRTIGVFGYTDFDGSQLGKTPDLIKWACIQLAFRNLIKLSSVDDRFERLNYNNIKRMRTRDQEIEYNGRNINGSGLSQGPFSGDNEIDQILMMYIKAPDIRIV